VSATPARVLVSGHDIGGLNLLAPLLRAWSSGGAIAAEFVGDGDSQRELDARLPGATFVRHVLDADVLSDTQRLDADLDCLIARSGCDAVLTATSSTCPIERRLILAAARRKVPTVAFCDMWWAMDTRFREPDALARPDELWLVDAVPDDAEPAPWKEPPALHVIGHPLYAQRIAQGWSGAAPVERGARRIVRFISEPASTRFPRARVDEFALAELALAALRAVEPAASFVVRPHPTEAVEPWRRWCWARRDDAVALDVEPMEACFETTARAIGIASSLLVEMRLAGIPAAVLRTPGADPAYYALPFAQMGLAVVATRDELAAWLQRVDSPLPAAADRHRDAVSRATALLLRLVSAHASSHVADHARRRK
jgi:hypothetical protein